MTVYLNQQFGPAVQVFHASLGYPEPSRFKSWSAVDRVLWPFISVLISRYYAVADPIGEIDAVFQNISEKLAISGVTAENLDTCGKYLAANCLSAADITFASHAAFVLLPQAKMGIQLMKLNNVKASQKLHIARWRSNLAGKYALLICERERKHIFATKADQSQHWVWDYISLPTLLIYIFSPLLALLVGPAKWVLLYWFMFIAFNVYGLVTFSRPTFNMIQEKVSYMKYLYSHRASEDFAKEKAQPDKERSIKTSLIGKNE